MVEQQIFIANKHIGLKHRLQLDKKAILFIIDKNINERIQHIKIPTIKLEVNKLYNIRIMLVKIIILTDNKEQS